MVTVSVTVKLLFVLCTLQVTSVSLNGEYKAHIVSHFRFLFQHQHFVDVLRNHYVVEISRVSQINAGRIRIVELDGCVVWERQVGSVLCL